MSTQQQREQKQPVGRRMDSDSWFSAYSVLPRSLRGELLVRHAGYRIPLRVWRRKCRPFRGYGEHTKRPRTEDYVGALHVVDIGVPRKLVEEMLKTA